MKDRKPLNSVDRDLDRQLDDQFRRADDSHDTVDSHDIRNEARGAQIVQTNSISTPVFVVLVVALFIAAAISMGAIGVAYNANYAAQMAEREARLALSHADNAANEIKVMKETRAHDAEW